MTYEEELYNLNKRKERLYSQIEVINYSIAEINQKIKKLIQNKFLGKSIKFNEENNIVYFHGDSWYKNIPPEIKFVIDEVTMSNIGFHFMLKNDDYGPVLISFNNLKEFQFI